MVGVSKRQMERVAMFPKVEDYLSKDGSFLRELYIVACVRSLSPRERHNVLMALVDDDRFERDQIESQMRAMFQ